LESEPTPFDVIGGADAVDAIVERFYAEMDAAPQARVIRDLHAQNLAPTKHVLKLYLGEWLGGPKLYSSSRGHPRLRMRHIKFPIGEAERDLWLWCMRRARARRDLCGDGAARRPHAQQTGLRATNLSERRGRGTARANFSG
jgi:hemoglobin